MTTTVIPAYGRDYTTPKAARADWDAGKDFIICDNFDPYDGKYVNNAGGVDCMIRFHGLRKTTHVKCLRRD